MDISNTHKAHPWHGIDLGENVPEEVRAFIEIVPTDTVKYEVDKASGYLSLDRPQKFSNIVPSLYGFLPRTYCSVHMAELTNQALARYDIGGLRLLDPDQADDKIIGVLKKDAVYGHLPDIDELPKDIIRRLIHYFTTYKDIPGENSQRMKFISIYGQDVAKDVILRSMQDYQELISEKHLAKPSSKK